MSLRSVLHCALLCLGLVAPAWGGGIDPALWKGLDVHAERLPGKTWFNGLAVEAVQLTGPGVDELVARWQDLHRGQLPLQSDADEWHVHSVIGATSSEVLQVRKHGDRRAIWSVMALAGQAPAGSHWALAVPAACKTGPEVSSSQAGEAVRQRTAICRMPADKALAHVRAQIRRGGFAITGQWPSGFEAADGKSAAAVFVVADSAGADTRLLLIEQRMQAVER